MVNKNIIRLNIAGSDYVITSEQDDDYIHAVAGEVNQRINELKQSNVNVSTMAALVLTSLDMCDEAKQAVAAADHLRSQIRDYLEDAARARNELEEIRRERDRLLRDNKALRSRLHIDEHI